MSPIPKTENVEVKAAFFLIKVSVCEGQQTISPSQHLFQICPFNGRESDVNWALDGSTYAG
jgi:hypothetical protein